MKKFLIVVCCCLMWGIAPLRAQVLNGGYLPLTWEQAGMLAARENKLVFVEVMSSGVKQDAKKEKAIFSDRRVADFLKKNAVMIRIDMGTPAGLEFAPRLMMNMYPVYAFFMPYGDLLSIVSPYTVAGNPQALVEAGEKAMKLAQVKRNNSRSIRFEEGSFEEILDKAGKAGKMVFVDAWTDYCQPCVMMEKDVFTLDSVADFYNRNFVNVRVHFGKEKELAAKYGIGAYPSYLFINSAGKLVYKAGGYSPAPQFIGYGQEALEKAKGVIFQSLVPEDVWTQARMNDDFVFLSFFDSADRGYKDMVKNVFTDPELADLFAGRFINVAWGKGQEKEWQEKLRVNTFPTFIYMDAGGKEIHRFAGHADVAGLLRETRKFLDGRGLSVMEAEYRAGKRDAAFVETYVADLGRAGYRKEAGNVALEYLSGMEAGQLKEKRYWILFEQYVMDANSGLFKYVYSHRDEFYQLYGQKDVDRKMLEIWAAGAENYVLNNGSNYTFDEAGLKEYSRRMKKEKVRNWREIARNARMLAAEKTGDWKRYVELAEEKWNEENIPDAELYSWGVKINQECRDEATRFKAARWFALAAIEMEQKERRSGKVNITSYKSFFEKLVDDLVGKK